MRARTSNLLSLFIMENQLYFNEQATSECDLLCPLINHRNDCVRYRYFDQAQKLASRFFIEESPYWRTQASSLLWSMHYYREACCVDSSLKVGKGKLAFNYLSNNHYKYITAWSNSDYVKWNMPLKIEQKDDKVLSIIYAPLKIDD